jgi:hypothetical protein
MTQSNELFEELRLLVTEAIEGTATPEQMSRLNHLLVASEKARKYYFEFIDIQTLTEHVCSEKLFFRKMDEAVEDELKNQAMLLNALALEEKRADSIAIEAPQPPREKTVVSLREHVRPRRTINRSSIVSAVLAAAAMLILVLFLRYAPVRSGIEVATLTDSMNAKWVNADFPMDPGSRLATSYSPMFLKEGIVQLLFDNNAEVLIEGPAEFQVIAADQIHLTYGLLFAKVPKEAIGFTVRSETAKVIDLGTEFGVSADLRGGVEVHVLQGKTLLFAGDAGGVTSTEVEAGAARKVTSEMTISQIPCNHRLFVRAIDSSKNLIWRGQMELCMIDMVIGGDGQCDKPGLGKLSLLTGRRTGELFVNHMGENPGFQSAPDIPFIDGVFVPDQGDGQVVTSTGVRFEQCPDTSGTAFYHISTIPEIPVLGAADTHHLALTKGFSPETGVLLLHPNAGITYDLSAIRTRHPDRQITAFQTDYGFPMSLYEKRAASSVGEGVLKPTSGTVDFYVLVDGQLRRKIAFRMGMPPANLRVPLTDQDRFLSLVSTDSDQISTFDWLILENPKIILEQ